MQKSKVKSKSYSKESSFTLLELLIVIAIIAILAAVVLIALNDAKQSAWEARGLQFSQNIKSTLGADLVGEWSFDDSANPGRDDSGNNIICSVEGAPQYYSNGKVRGSLKFFGNNSNPDRIVCNNQILNFEKSDFTVEFWIKKDAGGKWLPGIISKVTNPGFRIRYRKSSIVTISLEILNNSWVLYLPTKDFGIKEDKWYHIVISAKRDNMAKFYVNGEFKEEINISDTKDVDIKNNYPLMIGDDPYCRADYCGVFDGLIDEVRIYKRALTAYEIKTLYAEGLPRHLAER